MFTYTNSSYITANSILSDILYSEGSVSNSLKELFYSNICP